MRLLRRMTSLIRCRDLSQPGFRALSRDSCLPLQGQFDQLLKNPDYTGAADKAVNLVGCKSPHHQLPGNGWLACPMHAEETKHVLLGCKSLGCSATISRSGRNDLGGEQTWGPEHNEMTAVPKLGSVKKSF